MSLLEVFRSNKQNKGEHSSAAIARERLQIIITHERADDNTPDYLSSMKLDILAVIRKYVNVSDDQVNISFESQDDVSILELNVTLPESHATIS